MIIDLDMQYLNIYIVYKNFTQKTARDYLIRHKNEQIVFSTLFFVSINKTILGQIACTRVCIFLFERRLEAVREEKSSLDSRYVYTRFDSAEKKEKYELIV